MKLRTLLVLAFVALLGATAGASTFASSLVSSQFVTSFGSGLVTGSPDGGGLWLGDTFDPPAHPGYIVVGFSSPLYDGPGDDIRVYDVGSSSNETADIYVSSDGVNFTFVGGLNAVANTLDINGLFSGDFSFVKIANSSTQVSIDIDSVEGLNIDTAPAVPEPASMLLVGSGLLGIVKRFRRS